jgi:hypothetical protein
MATDMTKTMATARGTIATDRTDLSSEPRALGLSRWRSVSAPEIDPAQALGALPFAVVRLARQRRPSLERPGHRFAPWYAAIA